jgi:hypothetical protein
MGTSRLSGSVCACFLSAINATTHASGMWESTLLPRDLYGNTPTIKAYFDTMLGNTWLADANLAVSYSFGLPYDTNMGTYSGDLSGYHGLIHSADGQMTCAGTMLCIDAMNAVNYPGNNGRRLPDDGRGNPVRRLL